MNRRELEAAIAECERLPLTYPNCEKLATFYTIYDHLYTEKSERVETAVQDVIGDHGDSEFLRAMRGKEADEAWALMDELMQTLAVLNPRLYNSILTRLQGLY